jgi:hypothetical protein
MARARAGDQHAGTGGAREKPYKETATPLGGSFNQGLAMVKMKNTNKIKIAETIIFFNRVH